MKYSIVYEATMKKDLRRIIKRGYDVKRLEEAVRLLSNAETMPRQYKDHALQGEYKGFRECHLKDDWLLIYRIENKELILYLTHTGTHKDFNWS